MPEETFGLTPTAAWARNDAIGFETPDLTGLEPQRTSSIWDLTSAEFQDLVEEWLLLSAFAPTAIDPATLSDAQKIISTAIANDANSLLRQVDLSEGRAAALLARTMFEHLVNFRDVTAGGALMGERFMAHTHVSADQFARRRWHLSFLGKKGQRRERNKLDGVGNRTKKPLEDAINRYGTAFHRQWATGSLRERAKKHDLDDQYEIYRLLSGVVHGSPGMLRGLTRNYSNGQWVHRLGPDFELLAIAYEEGMKWYQEYTRSLQECSTEPWLKPLEQVTTALLLRSGELRAVLRREDRRIQPHRPVAAARSAVVAVYPSGRHRWFAFDQRTLSIALADPPEPEPDLSDLKSRAAQYDPNAYGGRPLTLEYSGVFLSPKRGADWVPAASILVPAEHPNLVPSKPR